MIEKTRLLLGFVTYFFGNFDRFLQFKVQKPDQISVLYSDFALINCQMRKKVALLHKHLSHIIWAILQSYTTQFILIYQ